MTRGLVAETAGVVLCGGKSSRLGRDKAYLPHPYGGDYLSYAIHRLASLTSCILIAGRNADAVETSDRLEKNIYAFADETPHLGPLSGIVGAMQVIDAANRGAQESHISLARPVRFLLVTPVDMPSLTADDLVTLVQAHHASAGPIHQISNWAEPQTIAIPTVGTFDGCQAEPLVALYPLELRSILENLLLSNQRGITRWLASYPHRLHRLPVASSININTPTDLEKWQ